MKTFTFMLLAAITVTSLKRSSVNLLELQTPEEYNANPQEYLEGEWDMTWAILSNVFEDPEDLNFVFESLIEWSSLSPISSYLKDLDTYCDVDQAGTVVFINMLDDLELSIYLSPTIPDDYYNVYDEYTLDYKNNAYTAEELEFLKIGTNVGVKEEDSLELSDFMDSNGFLSADELYITGDLTITYEECEEEELDSGEEEEGNAPTFDEMADGIQKVIDEECSIPNN